MGWNGADSVVLWVVFVLVGVHWLYETLATLKAKAEHEALGRLEAAQAAKAKAEERWRTAEIQREYMLIDEQTRHRLRVLVEERIQRLDLVAGLGAIEAAVVRMYKRSRSKI